MSSQLSIMNYLNIPERCLISQKITKKVLLENSELKASFKKVVRDDIQEMFIHVSALPLVGKGKTSTALACHPLHERCHADQGTSRHHPALFCDGCLHAHTERKFLGHRLANGSNCRTLSHHPILLVLRCLPPGWQRVPGTGKGREYRPLYGKNGLRVA